MLGRSRADSCQMIGCTAICTLATSTFKGIGCCPGPRNAAGPCPPTPGPQATQATQATAPARCNAKAQSLQRLGAIPTTASEPYLGATSTVKSPVFGRVMSSHYSCKRSTLPQS